MRWLRRGLLALVLLTLFTPTTAQGLTNSPTVTQAPPWEALIISNVGGLFEEPLCSGTVVGDGWVLTAAHCTYDSKGVAMQPRNLRVLIGRSSRNATSEGAAYGIARIVRVPGYIRNNFSTVDAALLQLQSFDSARWHALPLAIGSADIHNELGVSLYGYGNNTVQNGIEVGAGTLHKSPDGAFNQLPNSSCQPNFVCFRKNQSARIMTGDSGAAWLKWVSGNWQIVGVNDFVQNAKANGSHSPIGATAVDASLTGGQTFLSWVRQTAALPVAPARSIVRDPNTGASYLVDSDGYRTWIPTGGDYQCFEAGGSRIINMMRISLETIPERVGSRATCAAPTSPSTITEQQGSRGVNTFTNYHNASGLGPRVEAAQYVQVSCKVYDPFIASANPDGYWYRIASSPWDDQYYSPANTFMNGDPWGGPYTHNTDFAVPDC